MSSKVWNVVFLEKWGMYQPGDCAGFDKECAGRLIGSGAAAALKGLPVANKGDRTPGAGMTNADRRRASRQARVAEQMEAQAKREQQSKPAVKSKRATKVASKRAVAKTLTRR